MHKCWLLVLGVAACGDDHREAPQPDAAVVADAFVPLSACNETNLTESLKAIPHVTTVLEQDCGNYVMDASVRCFKLRFEQPLHHASPGGATFQQHLYLMHRGCDRPTLIADWGYSNDLFFDDELSVLFRANALWIEHRYQGESVPNTWDWTALTIKNGAADMHEIVTGFRKHYSENFVSTGASKGGITSSYHHYLYPTDLDGAIPYVAPASRSPIDAMYQTFLGQGFPACAQTLRNAQVAALTTRRPMMLQRLTAEAPGYEALMLERMTSSFDWAFWQYYGVQYCSSVPTAASTDTAFYNFFYQFSGFGQQIAPPAEAEEYSWGALYYEWLTEQGFALQLGAHVQPHLAEPSTFATMEDNFREMFPAVTLPAYDGTVTHAVRAWARDSAENLLLIYGQYDPWSGGAMETPTKATSARFFVPNATHNAQLMKLVPAERTAALAHATRMFGVSPVMTMAAMADAAATNRAAILAGKMRHLTTQFTLRRD
jgi:hypothetical protein